jgi:hypothetical protein
MVKGKCNCGKKATVEYVIYHKDYATTMKFCDKCKPKYKTKGMEILAGK